MTDQRPIDDQQELTAWIDEQFQNMGRYVANRGLITDTADGRPVWAVPGRVFLGRIWPKDAAQNAFWVIGGEVPSDHIDVNLAATAREAARHFSLKWQLQAAQIEGGGKDADAQYPVAPDWANVAERLVRSAETLYKMVEDDAYWVNVRE